MPLCPWKISCMVPMDPLTSPLDTSRFLISMTRQFFLRCRVSMPFCLNWFCSSLRSISMVEALPFVV